MVAPPPSRCQPSLRTATGMYRLPGGGALAEVFAQQVGRCGLRPKGGHQSLDLVLGSPRSAIEDLGEVGFVEDVAQRARTVLRRSSSARWPRNSTSKLRSCFRISRIRPVSASSESTRRFPHLCRRRRLRLRPRIERGPCTPPTAYRTKRRLVVPARLPVGRSGPCRIPDRRTLEREVRHWQRARNAAGVGGATLGAEDADIGAILWMVAPTEPRRLMGSLLQLVLKAVR